MKLSCLTPTLPFTTRASSCPPITPTRCGDCALGDEVPVRCCATCLPVVFICNSNAITDDVWDLLIDGILVGQHIAGMEARATVLLPQSLSSGTVSGLAGRGCSVFSTIVTPLLDEKRSIIVLTMRLAEQRGYGNYGTVAILCARPDAGNGATILPLPGGQFTYGDPTPYVIGAERRYRLRLQVG